MLQRCSPEGEFGINCCQAKTYLIRSNKDLKVATWTTLVHAGSALQMFSWENRWIPQSSLGILPRVEDFKYVLVSFMRGGRKSICAYVDTVADSCAERARLLHGFWFRTDSCYTPTTMSTSCDWKNATVGTCGRKGFLPKGIWPFIEAREACWKVWSFKQTQLLFIKARASWRGPGIWLACFLLLVELFHSFSIETIGWWDYVWQLAWAKNVRSGNLWLDWCLCDPDLMRMVNQYMNKTLCITCLLPSRLFAALTVSLNCRA